MKRVFVLFLLFFLPFIILPFGTSHFEAPKVVIAEIIILIVFLITLIKPQLHLMSKKYFLLYALILLGGYHLIFLGSQTTFLGNVFRGQGVLLLWILILLAVSVSNEKLKLLPRWVILVLLFLELLAAIFIETKEGRAVGTLGEPNALSAFVVFLWPFTMKVKSVGQRPISPWLKKLKVKSFLRRNLLVFICLVVTCLLIIFSGSRSGVVALGIQVVFLLAARFVSLGKATIIALILLLLSMVPPALDTKTLYENRGEIWNTALYAGYKHPIAGWGFGNTEVAFREYDQKLYNRLRGYYVDSSHNFVLDWWVQGGFVGLTILVLMITDTMRDLIRRKNGVYVTIFLGIISTMSFNPVSVVTLIQFWWLVGVGLQNFNSQKTV